MNNRFVLPKRKIRVDIVTLFLVLVALSSLTIILFYSWRNSKNMLQLADTMIEQVNLGLVEEIANFSSRIELAIQMASGYVPCPEDITGENQKLITFAAKVLNLEPYITSINIGSREGKFISVFNAPLARVTHYHQDAAKPLPEAIKYVVRYSDAGREIWKYLGTESSLIEEEKLNIMTYDPRGEEWFLETSMWPHLRWSKVHQNLWGETVITVSTPLRDASGNVFGVIGINLSLQQLSNYITHIQVGKTGKVFILSEGEVIIPSSKKLETGRGHVTNTLVAEAYEKFIATKSNHFLMTQNDKSYFVRITRLPLSYETKWLVEMIVPFDDFFGEIVKVEHQTLLISMALLAIYGIIVFFSSKHISQPIVELSDDVKRIQHFDFSERIKHISRIHEIGALQTSLNSTRNALRAFSRYVPKEIVKTLIERGDEIKLGGDRRELTVMFTDIANFTSASEALTIDQLTESLSAYFDQFSKVILENEGTIDKYIGDSIMAFWNAPKMLPDHADKACVAALAALKLYDDERAKNTNLPPWKTRIGIHTGDAVVGNIGTEERMNYTAIGNTVNLASRLQSMNKNYQTHIIISESVHEKIGIRYITRPLDFVSVKGKQNKITIYELVGAKEVPELQATEGQIDLCDRFAEAYALFHQGKLKEAKAAFTSLGAKYPTDAPTQLYIERLKD